MLELDYSCSCCLDINLLAFKALLCNCKKVTVCLYCISSFATLRLIGI
jgi:hypothetical protein